MRWGDGGSAASGAQATSGDTAQVNVRCSFCKKTQDEVRKLISAKDADGHEVYICDECVDLCNDIILGEAPSIIRPLRMAWRALGWRISGRVPRGDRICSMCSFPASTFRRPIPNASALICDGCLPLLNDIRKVDTEADRARWFGKTVTDRCSFCGRLGGEVGGLIAGRPSAFMCSKCVDAANRAPSTPSN